MGRDLWQPTYQYQSMQLGRWHTWQGAIEARDLSKNIQQQSCLPLLLHLLIITERRNIATSSANSDNLCLTPEASSENFPFLQLYRKLHSDHPSTRETEGDAGSPCRSPLACQIQSPGLPLIITWCLQLTAQQGKDPHNHFGAKTSAS
jgi:hypothetical protein